MPELQQSNFPPYWAFKINFKIDDYTTRHLLDLAYYKENYWLITIDLSKQTKIKDPQQINFIGKIEGQDNGVTMFFIMRGQKKLLLNFYKIL